MKKTVKVGQTYQNAQGVQFQVVDMHQCEVFVVPSRSAEPLTKPVKYFKNTVNQLINTNYWTLVPKVEKVKAVKAVKEVEKSNPLTGAVESETSNGKIKITITIEYEKANI